jgi:hypothetical protein
VFRDENWMLDEFATKNCFEMTSNCHLRSAGLVSFGDCRMINKLD